MHWMRVARKICENISFESWRAKWTTTKARSPSFLPTSGSFSHHDHYQTSTMLYMVSDMSNNSLDSIPSTSTDRDILHYVTNELIDVEGVHGGELLMSLARESSGLFEWARLACAYVKRENDPGLTAHERYEAIISHHKDDHVSPRPDVQVHIDINLSAELATAQGASRSVPFCDGTGTWNTGTTPTHFIALHEVSFHHRAEARDSDGNRKAHGCSA